MTMAIKRLPFLPVSFLCIALSSVAALQMLRSGLLALWCFAYVQAAPRVAPTLVYPRLLEGRSSDGQKLLRINDDLTLSLERTSVFSNPLTLTTHEGNAPKDVDVDVRSIEENLYHDPDTMSAVIMDRFDTGVHMEGILRGNLRIEPSLASARSADGQVAHALYEIEEPTHDSYADALWALEGRNLKTEPREDGPTSFKYPSIIYPELFVVTDYAHSGTLKDSELISYMAMFYASVNLRFKDLADPKVHFTVGRISRLGVDTGYILTKVLKDKKVYLNFTSTLGKFRAHYKEHQQDQHIAILMTGLDMVVSTGENAWLTGAAGVAVVGGLCTSNLNYAVAEDKAPIYSGIYVVAHELAHLLGALHDGTGEAKDCNFQDGYIMGANRPGPNHYTFSTCSEASMMEHLLGSNQSCLISMSETSRYIPTTVRLPGQNVTLDQYCSDSYGHYGFGFMEVDSNSSCKMYCCLMKSRSKGCRAAAAPDGYLCNSTQGHVCINGVCGNREELMMSKEREEDTGLLMY
ncbi:venom metalloproteinase BumaMPs1-like [Ornithodoros turicata]|uniref:venom metalloproteinase BumaMPs1-like n=1 Tax=Ornithodoros turicata TaxID=34597 RepID=UPI0031398890